MLNQWPGFEFLFQAHVVINELALLARQAIFHINLFSSHLVTVAYFHVYVNKC